MTVLGPVTGSVEVVPAAEVERLQEALRHAEMALRDARDGLDLGFGCARDLEGDEAIHPWGERSKRQASYLQRAREAHAAARAALATEQGGGR
jgi:hypothetical protein